MLPFRSIRQQLGQGLALADQAAQCRLQLRTAPLFEAGDERYAWLNTVQAVGIGTSKSGSVSYQVYALTV